MKNLLISVGAASLFFIIGTIILPNYGTSWDETLHFSRGHAYLNYFLTGKKDYSNALPRKSFYQLDYQSGDFWFKENGGHPPINGTLGAMSNYIFYQQLNWLSDVHSYNLFIVFVSSFLVFVVVYFAITTMGIFAAIITFLSLVTYPLFFGESHFNIKDPIETTFFAATIWTLYESLKKGQVKWLLSSVVFFALGLGTKFNILFLPVIILPYLLLRYKAAVTNLNLFKKIPISYLFVLFISPVIVSIIFFGAWPYLWENWPNNLLAVFGYYKEIGTGAVYQPSNFFVFGFNLFPSEWIVFTTPPVVLVLFLVGMIACIKNYKFKDYLPVLWLLWFLVPILRVTMPGTTIYGGIRQILEFLPAMALISGFGAWSLIEISRETIKKIGLRSQWTFLIYFILLTSFIWPIFVLIKIHPHQNVYFNFLIGGLKGAQERNFPSWGNSYGNAYLQGINWINENAPIGSKVALIQGTETNAPTILFRPDIELRNSNWKGFNREGEYLMDLTFNDTGKAFHYTWEYVDKFLNPVYEVRVDGVAILKIWKNDQQHSKTEYQNFTEQLNNDPNRTEIVDNKLIIYLEKIVNLSKVILTFDQITGCVPITSSVLETSVDGENWLREQDTLPFPQVGNKSNLKGNELIVHFAIRQARFLRFLFDSNKSCGLNNPQIIIYNIDP